MEVTRDIISDAIKAHNAPLEYLNDLQRLGCITIRGTNPDMDWNMSYLNTLSIEDAIDLYHHLKNRSLPPKLLKRVLARPQRF